LGGAPAKVFSTDRLHQSKRLKFGMMMARLLMTRAMGGKRRGAHILKTDGSADLSAMSASSAFKLLSATKDALQTVFEA
jgi:hypothetical protein